MRAISVNRVRSDPGQIWHGRSIAPQNWGSVTAPLSATPDTNSEDRPMLSNLDTAWRYPLTAFRESLDTLSPMGPWFLRYAWADLAARPSVLQGALIITGAVTVALTLVGLAGVHRGRLNQYDDAHFQSRRELKRNHMVGTLDQNGFIFGKLGLPKSDAPFVMAPPDRFPHAMMIAPTGRGKGVGFVIPNLLHFSGSAIILDVKGENFAKTSIHRKHGLKNGIWYFSR
ncbi:MAG: hypothetical protein B7Y91_01415 [Rhodobacterales bacterium 32-64-14]|nr:MAG: hypothetical protein B7Y91_01415 [Rhodobacterales bacterium 32-64-14]